MLLLHGGFAKRTGHEDFARLLGAIQALSKMACAKSTAPTASARLTIARRMLKHEDCVADMAVAIPKCATLRVARLLLVPVAVAEGMVRMDGARSMDAPPQQHQGSSIASHTVGERRGSRAPWRAALLEFKARASVVNTAAAKMNAGSQAAPTKVTAFSRPARSTAGEGTASTHQDASRQQPSTAQIARSIPRRRRRIERKTNGESLHGTFTLLHFQHISRPPYVHIYTWTGSLLVEVVAWSYLRVDHSRCNMPYGFGDSTGTCTIKLYL